eukprot:4862602-Prymnesium_polylepis.1
MLQREYGNGIYSSRSSRASTSPSGSQLLLHGHRALLHPGHRRNGRFGTIRASAPRGVWFGAARAAAPRSVTLVWAMTPRVWFGL